MKFTCQFRATKMLRLDFTRSGKSALRERKVARIPSDRFAAELSERNFTRGTFREYHPETNLRQSCATSRLAGSSNPRRLFARRMKLARATIERDYDTREEHAAHSSRLFVQVFRGVHLQVLRPRGELRLYRRSTSTMMIADPITAPIFSPTHQSSDLDRSRACAHESRVEY